MLIHLVNRAFLEARARTIADPGEGRESETEPPVSLFVQPQHQLAEQIVRDAVGRLAAMSHQVDGRDARPYARYFVEEGNFAKQFPEAATIFDNLHMLHDNFDDILARADLFPTLEAKRSAILKILPIYLNRGHSPTELYAEFHEPAGTS